MGFFVNLSSWLADNIFGEPAVLIGIIALIGLVVQKKSKSVVIAGTIKTILGFLIIQAGAGVVVDSMGAFGPSWQQVFGIEGTSVTGMGTDNFIAKYGGTITLMMTFGFLINVLLARITPFKYIYLTGHMMFWVCFVLTGIFIEVFGPDFSQTKILIIGSILMGIYWTLQPAYVQKYMRKVTDRDNLALGHTVSFAAWAAGALGGIVGDPKKSTENLKLPESLDFLKDSNVVIVSVMGICYGLGAILAGPEFMAQYSGNKNYIVYGILQGFKFAGGIAVILFGVKLLIAEIVPAFKGIATKIVPDAKPALDCPIVYPFAPTATIIGFGAAFVTSIIMMLIMGFTGFYVFVPPMIALFFHSAAAGVFGNATGGIRGAILGGVITGLIISLGQAVFVKYITPTTVSDFILWGGDTDMFIFGTILKWILGIFS
jgi:PTS system ascorbate-specific IIC component